MLCVGKIYLHLAATQWEAVSPWNKQNWWIVKIGEAVGDNFKTWYIIVYPCRHKFGKNLGASEWCDLSDLANSYANILDGFAN